MSECMRGPGATAHMAYPATAGASPAGSSEASRASSWAIRTRTWEQIDARPRIMGTKPPRVAAAPQRAVRMAVTAMAKIRQAIANDLAP